jgi:hypothetical protein
MFMLLPLLATVAVYSYSRQHGHKGVHWFAAGFLGATTLIYKYTALPILAFTFAVWLFEMHRSGLGIPAIFKGLACLLAGGILAMGLGLGFYLKHDALKSLGECTVVFNRIYLQSAGVFCRILFLVKTHFFLEQLVDLIFHALGHSFKAATADLVLAQPFCLRSYFHKRQRLSTILHANDAVLGVVSCRRHSHAFSQNF